MHIRRPALGLWAAAVLAGCTGGQSGTETPLPIDSGMREGDGGTVEITTFAAACPCTSAPRSALLHATLLELDACRLRARVDEVLAVAPDVEVDLEPGAELDAARDPGCGLELELAAGDPVLLVFAPAQEQDGENSALVATWGDEHRFGGEGESAIVLPQSERERLLDADACTAWFSQRAEAGTPAGEAPPISAPGAAIDCGSMAR